MQIHELNDFSGSLDTSYLAIDDGIETSKLPANEFQYAEMTIDELEAGTETDPRVISPALLNGYAVDKSTGNIEIDVTATSGDDMDLYDAITNFGWASDVISNGILKIKKLLSKILDKFDTIDGKIGDLMAMPAVAMTGTGSISAGASGTVTINFPNGYDDGSYRCLAINTLTFSGTNSDYIAICGFTVSNGNKTVTIKIRSLASSSTISYTANVYALFVKQ